jgi:BirA family biotin operon repressor/biotin-[acetyl-CoA-carboxylase] ligase
VPGSDAPLDLDRVRAALAGTRFADVRYVAETGSTNDDATTLLGDPAAAGTTLVAEHQTAGRGRKAGRAWIAPPGTALLFTAILPRAVASAALWAVPFWVALTLADGVEEATGIRLALRWPNDLDLHDRKAAGILCVSRVAGEQAFVGCGIGLNVRRPPDVPAGIVPPPAYLSDAAPHAEREAILAAVLGAADGLLDVLDDPLAVVRAWEARAELRGRPYRLRLDGDGSLVEGTAERIGPDGGLVVRVEGRERLIHLADARVVGEAAT